MATIDDETQNDPQPEPVDDPLTGRIRVKAAITVQVDKGESHYGSRNWEAQHETEFTFGPEASPKAVETIVGGVIARLLRVNDDPNDALKAHFQKVLDDQIRKMNIQLVDEDRANKAGAPEPQQANGQHRDVDEPYTGEQTALLSESNIATLDPRAQT